MKKIRLCSILLFLSAMVLFPPQCSCAGNEELLNFLRENINQNVKPWGNWERECAAQNIMPLSFYISDRLDETDPEDIDKYSAYKQMTSAQRRVVSQGVVIYDASVWQMALASSGSPEDLEISAQPTKAYWERTFGELSTLHAGYGKNSSQQPFIYDRSNPEAVLDSFSYYTAGTERAVSLNGETVLLPVFGNRGFLFSIIDALGQWKSQDPLTLADTTWDDWRPISGENAWAVMAALQIYHKKYFDPETKTYTAAQDALELKVAKELSRAALFLQADDIGAIRMAPLNTYNSNGLDFLYNTVSTENNLSWYAAFRMLYQITNEESYNEAMLKIEGFLKNAALNRSTGLFYTGSRFTNNRWVMNDDFATDCQTWAIAVLGPEKIDSWHGEGTAYNLWDKTKAASGYYENGSLSGVGFTEETDQLSVEWSAGAILAASILERYYKTSFPDYSAQAKKDRVSMRAGIEKLKTTLDDNSQGYSYSLKRKSYSSLGLSSHNKKVLSTASTSWVYLIDSGINPFTLGLEPETTKPVISRLSPSTLPAGYAFRIFGSDFGDKDSLSAVEIETGETVYALNIRYWKDNYIICRLPQVADGDYRLKVINSSGESSPAELTVSSRPEIYSLLGRKTKSGMSLGISGRLFGKWTVESKVTLRNVEGTPINYLASLISWNGNYISVSLPKIPVGYYALKVSNDKGTSEEKTFYYY